MGGPGELIARGRPADRVDPGRDGELGEEGGKRKLVSKGSAVDKVFTLVQTADKGGEDTSDVVSATSSKEDVVRVPVKTGNGGVLEEDEWRRDEGQTAKSNHVLLNVLGDPPVVFRLKIADGKGLGS